MPVLAWLQQWMLRVRLPPLLQMITVVVVVTLVVVVRCSSCVGCWRCVRRAVRRCRAALRSWRLLQLQQLPPLRLQQLTLEMEAVQVTVTVVPWRPQVAALSVQRQLWMLSLIPLLGSMTLRRPRRCPAP